MLDYAWLSLHMNLSIVFELIVSCARVSRGERKRKTMVVTSKQPHLWQSDRDVVALRRSIAVHWIRSSITIWILTFLIILIYLGGGVVSA